jgi:sugar O-acyltransferase (sialic acid O-acetyltransferase NeuD family)
MRNLVIFGDSQFSERLFKYISFEQKDRVVAFTQEEKFVSRKEILGLPVIPFESLKKKIQDEFFIVVGIGFSNMNSLKEKIYSLCVANNYKIASYISTNAIVYTSENKIGEGTFICPGAIIGPDCTIGVCNFIESGAVMSHDVHCANFNFISANVVFGGFTKIENNCFIGLNATIRDGINIANRTIIGSAANVLKSVEQAECVLVGNPARCLENKKSLNVKI